MLQMEKRGEPFEGSGETAAWQIRNNNNQKVLEEDIPPFCFNAFSPKSPSILHDEKPCKKPFGNSSNWSLDGCEKAFLTTIYFMPSNLEISGAAL